MRQIISTVSCCLLLFSSYSFAQSPNDECATATVISSLPFNTSQNTRLATVNASDPKFECNDTAGHGKTVWFKYAATKDTIIIFSTLGSTPTADYDVMLGLFSGSCGTLTFEDCNDDAEGTRQSQLAFRVKAGTTYYILVGEWNNGGTNGGVPTGGDLVFKVFEGTFSVIVKGPKFGSVVSGVTVSTNDFLNALTKTDETSPQELTIVPHPEYYEIPALWEIAPKKYNNEYLEFNSKKVSNYFEDVSAVSASIGRPVVQKGFQGFPMGTSIPPDPIMAVGPNHVMVMVNTSFRIFDKNGTLLKTVTAANFFNSIAPGTGPNDPQIIYDHFANRWVMLWMTNPTATNHRHLFAVSDDADPIGTWYQWNTSAIALGDSTTPHWGDYPALGYDSVALYLSSRQFPLAGGSFQYNKLRIVPKAPLYANTAGSITYTDFWDFRDPEQNATFDGIRPPNAYSYSDKAFFVNIPPFNPTNYMTIWTLSNPISNNPSITAKNVGVAQYRSPTQPQQLGGGTPLLESGSRQIRANGIYRDSALWVVHAVGSGPNNEYSAVRYVKFDPFAKKALEDVAFGASGYWYFYPAIAVNKNHDLLVTYSRSGRTEYPGAYISGRKKSDPAGLSTSVTMKEGAGNYVLTFGGTRNRWGDYNGIAVDPSDQTTMWAHTEYAMAKNSWGTWVASAKIGPLPGGIFAVNRSFLEFGTLNVDQGSDTLSITITNDGLDTLIISNIVVPTEHYFVVNKPATPFKLPSEGVLNIKVYFKPSSGGIKKDSIMLTTNDLNTPSYTFKLSGSGFQIVKAVAGTLYATSGTADGGNMYSVNPGNGIPELISKMEISQITALRVHPTKRELIGYNVTGSPNGGAFYRISSTGVNSQQISIVNVANLKGLAIYDDSLAYMGAFNGAIYKVNIYTGTATLIGTNSGLRAGGLAINPVNGTLWMSLRNTSGVVDNVYKLNRTTGVSTLVGNAGVGTGIVDIVFDKNGKLYGLTGTGITPNRLIRIDTTTGAASLIGELGKSDIQAIALDPNTVASYEDAFSGKIPTQFSLGQNYPNPFNPVTTIQYSIPTLSRVTLKVFDLIGREVTTLANEMKQAGTYSVSFDAAQLGSGVYFYRISAGSFSDIKKMVVLK